MEGAQRLCNHFPFCCRELSYNLDFAISLWCWEHVFIQLLLGLFGRVLVLQLFVPVCTHFWTSSSWICWCRSCVSCFLSSISVREVSTPRVAIPFGPISDPGASSSSSTSSSEVTLPLWAGCDGNNLLLTAILPTTCLFFWDIRPNNLHIGLHFPAGTLWAYPHFSFCCFVGTSSLTLFQIFCACCAGEKTQAACPGDQMWESHMEMVKTRSRPHQEDRLRQVGFRMHEAPTLVYMDGMTVWYYESEQMGFLESGQYTSPLFGTGDNLELESEVPSATHYEGETAATLGLPKKRVLDNALVQQHVGVDSHLFFHRVKLQKLQEASKQPWEKGVMAQICGASQPRLPMPWHALPSVGRRDSFDWRHSLGRATGGESPANTFSLQTLVDNSTGSNRWPAQSESLATLERLGFGGSWSVWVGKSFAGCFWTAPWRRSHFQCFCRCFQKPCNITTGEAVNRLLQDGSLGGPTAGPQTNAGVWECGLSVPLIFERVRVSPDLNGCNGESSLVLCIQRQVSLVSMLTCFH